MKQKLFVSIVSITIATLFAISLLFSFGSRFFIKEPVLARVAGEKILLDAEFQQLFEGYRREIANSLKNRGLTKTESEELAKQIVKKIILQKQMEKFAKDNGILPPPSTIPYFFSILEEKGSIEQILQYSQVSLSWYKKIYNFLIQTKLGMDPLFGGLGLPQQVFSIITLDKLTDILQFKQMKIKPRVFFLSMSDYLRNIITQGEKDSIEQFYNAHKVEYADYIFADVYFFDQKTYAYKFSAIATKQNLEEAIKSLKPYIVKISTDQKIDRNSIIFSTLLEKGKKVSIPTYEGDYYCVYALKNIPSYTELSEPTKYKIVEDYIFENKEILKSKYSQKIQEKVENDYKMITASKDIEQATKSATSLGWLVFKTNKYYDLTEDGMLKNDIENIFQTSIPSLSQWETIKSLYSLQPGKFSEKLYGDDYALFFYMDEKKFEKLDYTALLKNEKLIEETRSYLIGMLNNYYIQDFVNYLDKRYSAKIEEEELRKFVR